MPGAGLRPGSGARLMGRVLNPGSRVGCRFGGPGLAVQLQARLWALVKVRVQARVWVKWFVWRSKGQGLGLESRVRL